MVHFSGGLSEIEGKAYLQKLDGSGLVCDLRIIDPKAKWWRGKNIVAAIEGTFEVAGQRIPIQVGLTVSGAWSLERRRRLSGRRPHGDTEHGGEHGGGSDDHQTAEPIRHCGTPSGRFSLGTVHGDSEPNSQGEHDPRRLGVRPAIAARGWRGRYHSQPPFRLDRARRIATTAVSKPNRRTAVERRPRRPSTAPVGAGVEAPDRRLAMTRPAIQ